MTNRFDQGIQFKADIRRFTPQIYQPDFGILEKQISSMDKNYNAASDAKELFNPAAREIDKTEASKYKQEIDTKYDDIYNEYKTNGVAAGNKSLRDFINHLKSEKADPNSKFNKFGELLKKETDYYKNVHEAFKDKSGSDNNRYLAMKDYYDNYGSKDINNFYDSKTGVSKGTISNPDRFITPYMDVQGELIKELKSLKKDELQQILGNRGASIWLEKHTLAGISKEKINNAASKLLDGQKYRGQLKVDARVLGESLSVPDARLSTKNNLDKIKSTLNNKISEANKLAKGDKKSVAKLQKILNGAGFNAGSVDGIIGEKTLEALDQYKNALNENKNQANKKQSEFDNLSDEDYRNNLAYDKVKQGYIDQAESLFLQNIRKVDLKYNKANADRTRNGIERQKLHILHEQLKVQKGSIFTTPDNAIGFDPSKHEADLKSTVASQESALEDVVAADSKIEQMALKLGGSRDMGAVMKAAKTAKDYETFIKDHKGSKLSTAELHLVHELVNGNDSNAERIVNTYEGYEHSLLEHDNFIKMKYQDIKNKVANNDKLKKIYQDVKEKYDLSDGDDHKIYDIMLGKGDKIASSSLLGNLYHTVRGTRRGEEYSDQVNKIINNNKELELNYYGDVGKTHLTYKINATGPLAGELSQFSKQAFTSGKRDGKIIIKNTDGTTSEKESYELKDGEKQEFSTILDRSSGDIYYKSFITRKDGSTVSEIRKNDTSVGRKSSQFLVNEYVKKRNSNAPRDEQDANDIALTMAKQEGFLDQYNYKLSLQDDIIDDSDAKFISYKGADVKIPHNIYDDAPNMYELMTDQNGIKYGIVKFNPKESGLFQKGVSKAGDKLMIIGYNPKTKEYKAERVVTSSQARAAMAKQRADERVGRETKAIKGEANIEAIYNDYPSEFPNRIIKE